MTMNDLTNATPADDDPGARCFQRRVEGVSERQLAREYGLTGKEVRRLIDSHLPKLDRELAKRLLGLDLERLDQLLKIFYSKAMNGDPVSAGLCLKILERRGAYLGLDTAPTRTDPMTPAVDPPPQASSTERIYQALQWVASQKAIDGETSEVASPEPPATGEGSVH